MAGERFVITEVLRDGSFEPSGAASFEWTAELRSVPRRPWTFGTVVRNKRTDYPGGDDPTHQVFGPNSKDQALEGTWDDRYNGAGYARSTRRAFNDMVRRGNLVRIEFSGLAFLGLITDADYPYDYDSKIGYRFTFSPQVEEDAMPLRLVGNADRPLSAQALVDNLSTDMDTLRDLRADAPGNFAGTVLAELDAGLATIEGAFAEIDGAVQQRIVDPGEEARVSILRVGQLFGQVRSAATGALDLLIVWKADAQLAWRTAQEVIHFDRWVKEMGFNLRLLGLHAHDSADEVQRRADPEARGLYRPYQGEDLRGISQRFYGTPNQWRGIMTRNGLTSPILTGDELLILPAAGVAS
jgi:hypothetical protein